MKSYHKDPSGLTRSKIDFKKSFIEIFFQRIVKGRGLTFLLFQGAQQLSLVSSHLLFRIDCWLSCLWHSNVLYTPLSYSQVFMS